MQQHAPDVSAARGPQASPNGSHNGRGKVAPVVDVAGGDNADYVAGLYDQYLGDPASVPQDWQAFFAGFALGSGDAPPDPTRQASPMPAAVGAQPVEVPQSVGVYDLVHTYRDLGHVEAHLDPLAAELPAPSRGGEAMLSLDNFGLDAQPDDLQVGNGGFLGPCDGTLGDLVAKLRETYCGTVGVEFTGISDKAQRDWLTQQMEPTLNRPQLSGEQKKHLLRQIMAAEEFEQYLGRVFVGSKRFSVEGAESLIPLMNTIIEGAADLGGEQVIAAMAHRGRLNVLAHVLQKPYELMMAEFAGTVVRDDEEYGDGDVKYHLGYANRRVVKSDTDGEARSVKVSLLPNPSHLELINPIQQGIVRCKQQWLLDGDRTKVVPVCLHGDAAFVGQGIVFETLNLSELVGYRTGGTIHVIVNNQIGFTTPPKQGRFTPYPTDVAKSIQAPVFHVNGDDPEAVWHVAQMAIAFRQQFKQDVVIDLWCYRRYGHNEQDEPGFTQPLMYKAIKAHPSVRELYGQKLVREGVLSDGDVKAMKAEIVDRLKAAREKAGSEPQVGRSPGFSGVWRGLGRSPADYRQWTADTAVDRETLETVAAAMTRVPAGFTVHPKLLKVLEGRVEAVRSGEGIDWGTGEFLAFGSLLLEGTNIRFTGQDVERGTFSHRHDVLHDYDNAKKYRPLRHVGGGTKHENQGRFDIINSMLSEEAVLAFDWGFASADPRNLVVWEAQFGDFVNGAQNIIDQILAASESKWRYMNGIVLNLPHGYEGQGPEHSNAYLERFLSLCAEENMQVCVPTTPAQYFHLLRRQILRRFRKPLINMSPKSLLRKPEAASRIEDFADATFQLVIDDAAVEQADRVRRVVLCSGKVYYALDEARGANGVEDVALVRVEQLYPFPEHEIKAILGKYRKASEIVWCQEEPQNRGAWTFVQPRLRELFPDRLLDYVGRDASASPAAGSKKVSDAEEEQLVAEALTVAKPVPATA